VTWSVLEAGGGTITATGLFTPARVGSFTVMARSVADDTRWASANVMVKLPLGEILSHDRLTVWNPGLNAVGGIPRRTAVCATLSPSGGDDTAPIQAALDACPEDGVVQLEAGAFAIGGEGLVLERSGITLRGRGPALTRLIRSPDSNRHTIIFGHRWVKYTQPTDLAADAPAGSYSVTLVRNPGLEVGEVVLLDQQGDPRWSMWNPTNQPPGDGSRGWFCRYDRPLAQVMEIVAVQGTTVTFDTPVHLDFLVANAAQLARYSAGEPDGPMVPVTKWSGVEDLFVGYADGGLGNVHFFDAAYCWAKNIESAYTDGVSVNFDGSFRCELRDSFVHTTVTPNPGGGGYGLGWSRGASDNLVENNVVWNFNKVMVMRASGGGNVIGYNYLEDGWGAGYPDIPEVGLNASHMATPHHELFEGNQSWNFSGDSYWGNSIYITAFRNHLTGRRRSLPPLQLVDAIQRRFVDVPEWHFFYSFVGNVLGTPDMTPAPQSGFVYEAAPPWSFDPVPLWVIGPQWDSGLDGQDPVVAATTLRHGNYDFLTGGAVWDPGIASHDLPDSLYLSGRPAFFGTDPWPWVTPEDPVLPLHTLPAQARFDAGR
jgi:hypothetical protein